MSDDPVRLSLRLCKVLERIGVSEKMRKMHRDTSISREIMDTITFRMIHVPISLYIFGSSCEGTTTPGMDSDIDIVLCLETIPVIEDIQDAPTGVALLAVTSRDTKHGYVKLQAVEDGTPLTIHNYNIDNTHCQYDCEGRVCKKHVSVIGRHNDIIERNGPADTVYGEPGLPARDQVLAYRGNLFPQNATDALQKCIACGWVSTNDVERMKRFGVLFVGVGYQSSVDREVEWRMSFSFQERELMFNLNPTQHKCYVLLKKLKNIVTAHPVVEKLLTSYHCKTCLFTVITNTSPALWTEENLIQCTYICLTELSNWICRGHCANFFIDQNNMFDRQEFRQAQERLLYHTREVLRGWPEMLYHIESDHLGEALRGLACRQIDENRMEHMYVILCRLCDIICWCQNAVLKYCHKLPSTQHITRYLFQQLCYLTSEVSITEHTQEQTQSFMHKLYAQHVVSVVFSIENPTSRQLLLEVSTHHIRQGNNSDLISCKLLEATILYRLGNIETCRNVLEHIERQIMHGAVVSFCKCYPGRTRYINDYLMRNVSSGYTNQENIMKSAVAPCMIFLPSQSVIIPKALQYEMYRSVYASPESTDEYFTEWYEFAGVDSKIYLHFMQYLVHSDLNQPLAKRVAVDQIWKTLDRDPNLGHNETAYNLLGWIYIQEGQLQEAVACFCYSWQIRPDHNAAKWHITKLLMRLGGQQKSGATADL